MQLIDVILIGIALSIDACALTIANCTTYKHCLNAKKEWSMPITFALFQGAMPLIGYFIGHLLSGIIEPIVGFLSALIFLILAVKIVIDIIKEKKEEQVCTIKKGKATCNFTFIVLIIQAIATSIDALAVGVTFISLPFSVFVAVLIIMVITFILVTVSLIFGKKLGNLFGGYAEWVGAVILFALAIKTLVQTLV
jgi:putative Mn2+ efflux pump MntP